MLKSQTATSSWSKASHYGVCKYFKIIRSKNVYPLPCKKKEKKIKETSTELFANKLESVREKSTNLDLIIFNEDRAQ